MSRYRILSLDGGGIRGVLTVVLLERLEQLHPTFLQQIDLFAGTSTGGLLALGLAAGKTPAAIRRLYETQGRQVFADSLFDDVRDLGHLIGAQYSLAPLKDALTELFGDLTLADLPRRVLISAFDLDNRPADPRQYRSWKAKFFHNFPGAESDGAARVVDVALYTAAAPTYFPTYQGFIDGGVVAGNPSVCALAQALHPGTGGQKLEDIALLSLGTGHNPKHLELEDADWGLAQWAAHLVTLMLEGSTGLADYQCRQFLADAYFRLNPRLPYEIDMDCVDEVPLMAELARQCDLDDVLDWLERCF
ncbi:MAG: patatin-like phospholipase family protein [Chloroflexota bacterium]